MAYNNPFPASYQPINYQPQNYVQQPQVPQMQPQQVQPQTPSNNPMIWVQGETGAKSYLLAPNTTLPLWDSESQVIYLKSTDASGMPSMKILEYTIRDNSQPQAQVVAAPQQQPMADFVTHKELEELENKIVKRLEDTGA